MRRFEILTAEPWPSWICFVPQACTIGRSKGRPAAGHSGDSMQRTGDKGTGDAMNPDAEGIGDVWRQIAEAAVTKDGVDDLSKRFVDAIANRLGSGDPEQ